MGEIKPTKITLQPGTYAICTCDNSSKDIFCDGKGHRGTDFRPEIVQIEVEKKIAICRCKKSKILPWCDGEHRYLK